MKETRLAGIKHGCRLLRHDVEELISTTCRGIDEKHLTISTEQEKVVTSGKTLSELEEEAGHPQRLNNLGITVYDFNLDRQVHVKIDNKHAFYQVKGIDSTWTNGRFAELDNILRRTRSLTYRVYYALASISSLGGFVALAFHDNLFAERDSLLIGAALSMFCLAVALWTLTFRAWRNRILLQNVSRAPRDAIQLVGLGVVVLGLIVSAVQLGLAIFKSD
ncbi:MAG: hypothetical protein LC775_09520 [Acidobacteria bacterium]|nr:hypothetical protein [Acidobacteriota bacterium]